MGSKVSSTPVRRIGPRFHARGDTAEDSLRLQKPLAAFDREGLVAEGELGQKLVDFILGA